MAYEWKLDAAVNGFSQLVKNLGPARLAAMGLVIGGMMVFFTFISSRLGTSPQSILFADLELVEAAEVTERLTTMQIPYKMSSDGRTIFAPSDEITQLRMQFAAEGIGGGLGYELLDKQDALGTTSFMQQVNHRRAIEGELARTIQSINTVREARVHLVMPERALFAEEQTEPSASVVLRTKAGRLSIEQVRAIRQLIAASVPSLAPERISIVDQYGSLLARIDETGEGASITDMHERQIAMQTTLERQIEDLLERTVGPGRVRAEVSVTLNNERVSTQSEIFDPEAQVVVSSSVTERTSSETETEGGTVSVADNLPDGEAGGAEESSANNNETQETTNFQNSRTQTTRVKEIGSVERLSVAVLVDGTYTKVDGTEDPTTYAPRPAEEIAQMERLVKGAIGFNDSRGDTIEIASMQFTTQTIDGEAPEIDTILGLDMSAFERTAEIGVLGIVSILVLLLVVRPIVKKVIEAAPVQQQEIQQNPALMAEERPQLTGPSSVEITPELLALAAEGDEDAAEIINAARLESENQVQQLGIDAEIDVAQVEGRLKGSALKKVGTIITKNPDESAAIVRQWLHGT
ncbi:MAG: flagellar basal-body MS-ring/collar protein FliF [Pseudomonadota bacterium]